MVRKPAPTQPPKDETAESEKIREMIRNITRDNATYDASKLEKMSRSFLEGRRTDWHCCCRYE